MPQHCGLCPRYVSFSERHCGRCGGQIQAARAAILRRLILPRAAEIQRFAELNPPAVQTSAPPKKGHSTPAPKPSRTGEVAAGGKDGLKAAQLLGQAKDAVTAVIQQITRTAVARLIAAGRPAQGLYTGAERAALTEALASVTGAADLLGRSRIAERASIIQSRKTPRFSERSTPYLAFADPIQPMAPEQAVDYFTGLVPQVGTDPKRFGADQRRKAFTLAVATEKTLLVKVQTILDAGLKSGESQQALTQRVQAVLDRAGVSTSNPQYAEMVVRTNMMDAYNTGQTRQMQEMGDFFPVWRYDGIRDGREGDDHRPHFGKYYPASAAFSKVRGKRPYNCRCTMTPVDQYEWEDLQKQGARVEPGWGAVEKPPVKQPKAKPVVPAPVVDPLKLTRADLDRMKRGELLEVAQKMGTPGAEGRSTKALRTRLETDIEQANLRPVPSPVPATDGTKPKIDSRQAVAAAFKRLDTSGFNQVAIADLKDATGLDTPTLHAAIQDLRRQGALSASQAEREIDKRTAATAIQEGGSRLVYVGAKQGGEESLAKIAGGGPEPKSGPKKSKGDAPTLPPAVAPGRPAPALATPEASQQIAAKVAADSRSEATARALIAKHDQARARIEQQIAEQKKAAAKAFVTGTDEERKRIKEALKQAEDDRQTLRELARDDLIKQLAPAETHTLKTTNLLSGQAESRAKFGVNFVQKVMAKLPGDGQLPGVTFVKTEKGERANFKDYYGDGRIALGRNDDEGTAVHELGHYIEEKVPGVREAVQAFLRHRVGDEPLKSMREVDPGAKYGKDEMGREDDFAKYFGKSKAHYVGKYYEDGSTEILSMGIEALHRDPVGFMKADPEYARFVIGVLNGSIRK